MVGRVKDPVRTHRAKLKSIPGATPPGGSFASGARVHIASKRIASGKKVSGVGMVHTPWYPEGVGCDMVNLDSEVADFFKFMTLTPHEISTKMELRTSLQSVISTILPNATVKLIGSFAYGTMLPTSTPDFVLEATPPDQIPHILDALTDRGFTPTKESQSPETTTLHLVFPDGRARLIIDTRPVSPLRRIATIVNKWLGEYPEAKPIICLLRHVLGQCKYVGCEGGLTGYLITLLVIPCCRDVRLESDKQGLPVSPGAVLLRVLTRLGKSFDPTTMAVDPASPSFVPKPHPDPLSILDPLDPTINTARTCTNFVHVRIQISYILSALEGWRTKLASKKNYKGRTPLSSIMSHIPLWPRQKELQNRAKERDTMRAS
eukprot:TRINITY_DN1189_c0_g1_i1.p1 TRINITY_DN1189_c0_g1~~TRINITY_DN1189_c0_g1_i1.p1  ORF type:complete len:376 (+),score=59.49 TRINITY_DN1189_c0_g1_i1:128-1255(+)